MLQFNFDATKGETPASIAQKRALVAQLMTGGRAPQNVGEGFSAIGDGIVANVLGGRAEAAEAEGRSGAQDIFRRLITGQGGAPTPSYDVASIAPQTASDATAAMAGGGDFISALVNSESGGNWQALNNEGYGGRLQFGEARLADAARAGIIPPGMTGADFAMMPPEVQQAVEQWHFADIDRQAQEMGLTNYYGQTIAGVPINENSIRSMAHLGGIGGAQKFVTTGGQYNPADSNGTRLSDYGSRFGGMGGGTAAPVQVAQGPDMAALMEAASNPFIMADPGMASVVNSMLQQQMQMQDPAYRQQLARGDLEIQKLQRELNAPPPLPGAPTVEEFYDDAGRLVKKQWNAQAGTWEQIGGAKSPDAPSSVKEYDAYAADEVAAGREPLSRLEYEKSVRAAGASQISLGDQGQRMGAIPAGYTAVPDPSNPSGFRLEMVPGGPAEAEAAAAADKAGMREGMASNSSDTIVSQAAQARALIGGMTTGAGGWIFSNLPFTDAADMYRYVGSLKASAAAENLNQMRQSSPTGGALGNASDADIRLLQDKAGALDPASPRFPEMLDDYERTLLKIVHGPEAGERIFRETRPGGAPAPAPQSTVDPNDIDALLELYK